MYSIKGLIYQAWKILHEQLAHIIKLRVCKAKKKTQNSQLFDFISSIYASKL